MIRDINFPGARNGPKIIVPEAEKIRAGKIFLMQFSGTFSLSDAGTPFIAIP